MSLLKLFYTECSIPPLLFPLQILLDPEGLLYLSLLNGITIRMARQ